MLDGNIPKRLCGLGCQGDLSYGQPSLEKSRKKSSPFLLFGGVVAPRIQLRVGPHRMSAWGQSEQPLPSLHHVPLAFHAVTHSVFSLLQGSSSLLHHPLSTVVSLRSSANHNMIKSRDGETLPAFPCAHSTAGHGSYGPEKQEGSADS